MFFLTFVMVVQDYDSALYVCSVCILFYMNFSFCISLTVLKYDILFDI